jgi:hypothetical protein
VKARHGAARAAGAVLAALLLTGCKTPVRSDLPGDTPNTVDELAAAIAADARRSDTETDSKIREQLSADASRDAEACLTRAPGAVACLYYDAIALGLEARAHPLHAGELLKTMLDALTSAEAADRGYDHAGAARVRALVLIKAPAWPLGPGDADAGLVAARRAVDLEPAYPPNVLALAEALAKTGDVAGSRRLYGHAREMAAAMAPAADRDNWLRQANQGLRQ